MTHLTVHEWGRVAVADGSFTRGEADALLAAARAHSVGGVDGTDILCDHHRFLRARQMVGVVAARGCSLEILPKIDPETAEGAATVRGRLVHMLDVALGLGLSTGETATMARRADSLLEVFIVLFADRLLAEARRGLPRRYREHEDDLRALRGRLDVARQFTVNAVRPDRLACRFDALDADRPLLQVMKACVLLLGRYARRAATQRKLAELRFLLADITEVPRSVLPWRQVQIDRSTRRWQTLLHLARLLMGGSWQETHADARAADGITLLFPMNDLFEAYIAALARRALAPWGIEVKSQRGGAFCLADWSTEDEAPRGRLFATKPDIMLVRNGRTLAIVDTKWKAIGRNVSDKKRGVAQSDIYQMMAYGQLYGADRLMLLYPHHRGLDADGVLAEHRIAVAGGAKLDIATVDVTASKSDCIQALASLLLPFARTSAEAA